MGFVTSIAKRRPLLAALALAAGSVPAAAQFSDSYNFLKAVRDRDVTKATELAQKPGAPVNARDYSSGETPLILAVQQRDPAMVRLLLAQGADPKISDRVAGKSARDYAAEDNRAAAILKLLDDAKPKAAVTGPVRP